MESLPTAIPDELINSDRAYLFLLLRCTDTGKVLSVGNIHTTFDLFKVMDLTTLEIIFAINGLIQFAGGLNTPHILCGDFNQETHHPGYQLIRDGFLNSAMKDYLRNIRKQLIDVFHDSLTHESDSLQSAYKTVVGHEVPFSNYEDISQYMKVPKQDVPSANSNILLDHGDSNPKIHKTDPETYGSEIYIAPLDYIWFSSDSLHCSGVLEMVQVELIVPFHACPNKAFPSDHLPIKAKFTFL